MTRIAIGIITYPISPMRVFYLAFAMARLRRYVSATRHDVVTHCSCESDERGDVQAVVELCKQYDVLFYVNSSDPCMGANSNNSMRVAFGELGAEYLLHLIDDSYAIEPLDLSDELDFLAGHPEIDILRYHWSDRPGARPTIYERGDGYMQVDPKSYRFYDDSPHIRRASYVTKFGWHPTANPARAGWVERETTRHLRKCGANIVATPRLRFEKGGRISACREEE